MKKFILGLMFSFFCSLGWATNYCTDSNTKAAYKLDETSGTVTDCSSNANNSSSVTNVTQNTTGKWGVGVSFTNSNPQKILIPSSTSLNNINPITVCAWIKRSGAGGATGNLADDGTLLSKNWRSWALSLNTTLQVRWSVHYSGGTAAWTTTNGSIVTGTYTHVCVVHNRTNGSAPSIYVNGTLQSTNSNSTDATIDDDSGQAICMGEACDLNSDRLNAFVDEVLIYGGALNSTQVTNIKNCGIDGSHCANGFPTPDLWRHPRYE